jgi:hypothetical protein
VLNAAAAALAVWPSPALPPFPCKQRTGLGLCT